MVGLLSWGRCCEERLTNPCRHITRVPKLEALSRHCHEDFDPNFCRSSALSLGLVPFPWLFVVSIYKLGGSGIPGDSLERMRWQPGYKGRICSFSSPEATVAPCPRPFRNGVGYKCLVLTSEKPLPGLVGYPAPISVLGPDSKTLMGNTGEGEKSLSPA